MDDTPLVSDAAQELLTKQLHKIMKRSGLLKDDQFIAKGQFKKKGYPGSGGLAKFRNTLWASIMGTGRLQGLKPETLAKQAETNRDKVMAELGKN